MKKIILACVVCVLCWTGVCAQKPQQAQKPQDPQKAKEAPQPQEEKEYAPIAGDFSIGFGVSPVFSYLGNMLNGYGKDGTPNTLAPLSGEPVTTGGNFAPTVSIMGKYMYDDDFALIANIGIIGSNATKRAYVQNDKAVMLNPLSEEKLIDVAKDRSTGISMLLGGEYRLGDKRIQGIGGAGLMFAFEKSRTTYAWANQITDVNQLPTSSFEKNGLAERPLEEFQQATSFAVGIVGHVGVEYFIAPKISLGAVVNLIIGYEKGAQKYEKTETYNAFTDRVEERTDLKSPGDSRFFYGTDNLGGSLYISFYF